MKSYVALTKMQFLLCLYLLIYSIQQSYNYLKITDMETEAQKG